MIARDHSASRELRITPEQLAVLRSCQRDPENPLWSQALALIVGGLADEGRLRRAIHLFVRANDIFSSRFKSDADGRPLRITARDDFTSVEFSDARDILPDELASEINWIILDEGEYGYDLAGEHPLRVRVLRIGDDRWLVLFLFHRLVYQRGDKCRYLDAFRSALQASTAATDSAVLPPVASYFDYIQQIYDSAVPDVPASGGSAPVLHDAGIVTRDLTAVQGPLRLFAEKHDVSLPDILLSGAVLWNHMFRRVESQDFMVDLPADFLRRANDIVGPLSQRAAIAAEVPLAATIADFARNLGSQLFAAGKDVAYQRAFGGGGRTPVGSNGSRILCRFYDLDRVNNPSDDFSLGWSDADITSTEHDLELIFKNGADGLSLVVVYNQGLLSFEKAESWIGEISAVIFRLAEQFDQSVVDFMRGLAADQVALLPAGRSLNPWPTRALAGAECAESLATLFSAVAAQYPDNIAIRTPTESISYRELDALSSEIARTLYRRVGRGGRIGILLEQGVTAIAAIFAVLKSGNAYVPLDVSMPESRLQVVVADAELALLISDGKSPEIRPGSPWEFLPVWSINQLPDPSAADLSLPAGNGDDDAYIIYTSGSTGTPKGVLQNQRNVLYYIETYSRMLGITPHDSLSLMSAYLFDAAVVDIFTTLLNGATLVVFDLKKEDFSSISRRLQASEVTIFHSTPSVFRYYTESLDATVDLGLIRYVVLGGEQVRRGDLVRFTKHFAAGASLVNLYGSSELSIGSMAFFPHGMEVSSEVLPIGVPFDSIAISMLNEDGVPTPGVGQLVVSSPYLAKEYWKRPDLTAEKFSEGHCAVTGRSFLTGDIAEITAAGELRHLGRSDFQIKIRGYRVEPGEIEARVIEYDGIAKCIVHPVAVGEGELSLVAFIIPKTGTAGPGIEGLTNFLKESLPDYMVPKIFLPLPSFPETRTRKIDRRKLEEIANEYLSAK